MSATIPAIVRMPRPKTKEAPSFKGGDDLSEFFLDYENCADEAGYADSKKCESIILYCETRVKRIIEYMPEYISRDWAALKEALGKLYGASSRKRSYSKQQFETWLGKPRKINNIESLEKYHRRFVDYIQRLDQIDVELVPRRDKNALWYKGLPVDTQKIIRRLIRTQPDYVGKTPYDYKKSQALLSQQLEPDLFYVEVPIPEVKKRRKKVKKSSKNRKYDSSDESGSETDKESAISSETEGQESDVEVVASPKGFARDKLAPREKVTEKVTSGEKGRERLKLKTKDQVQDQLDVMRSLTEGLREMVISQTAFTQRMMGPGQDIPFQQNRTGPRLNVPNSQINASAPNSSPYNHYAQRQTSGPYKQAQAQYTPIRATPLINQARYAPTRVPPTDLPTCSFCDTVGAHGFGLSNCPEVHKMISQGIIKYNAQGFLTRMSGESIALGVPGRGGMKATLEAESQQTKTRENPPHLASTLSILDQDGESPFERYINSITALNGHASKLETGSFAADHTKKSDNRYNPIGRPLKATGKPTGGIKKPLPIQPFVQVPALPRPEPAKEVQHKASVEIIPDEEDSEMELDTWVKPKGTKTGKESLKEVKIKRKGKEDVSPLIEIEDEDGYKKLKIQPAYRYTSALQSKATPASVLDHILGTKVEMSVTDAVGSSAILTKLLHELTATRKEPQYAPKEAFVGPRSRKPAEINQVRHVNFAEKDSDDESDEEILQEAWDEYDLTSHMKNKPEEDSEEDHEFIPPPKLKNRKKTTFFANNLTLESALSANSFARSTGKIRPLIGGKRNIECLIDTGSELNLISEGASRSMRLAMNTEGDDWSVKGVNGDASPLIGCCCDVAIELGRGRFDHNLFVSTTMVSAKHQIILGQPFLHDFRSQITYEEDGMTLRLYADGDSRGKSIIVALDHNNSRNTRSLTSSWARAIRAMQSNAIELLRPRNAFEVFGSAPSPNAVNQTTPFYPTIGSSASQAL